MYQYWVTEIDFGNGTPETQMKILNQIAEESPDHEFMGVDANGHYIFRMPKEDPTPEIPEVTEAVEKIGTSRRIYDVEFDSDNPNYQDTNRENLFFLKNMQDHLNNLVTLEGYVFLNDVLYELGIPRISDGQIVGWTKGPISFNVNFVEPDMRAKAKPITLHLEVEGVMYDKI